MNFQRSNVSKLLMKIYLHDEGKNKYSVIVIQIFIVVIGVSFYSMNFPSIFNNK